MKSLQAFKLENDDFQVEYEILSPIDPDSIIDSDKQEILLAIQDVDKQISMCEDEIAKLNADIDRLTNHADGLDCSVAVISGIVTGMIDSLFVGKTFDIDNANEKEWAEIAEEILAKNQKDLEKKYHTANDSAYMHKKKDGRCVSSAMYHRLDDLAHHPTPIGLIASILVRYFRLVFFVDGSDGKPHIFFADTSNPNVVAEEKKQLQKAWVGAVIGGICIWLSIMAEKKCNEVNNAEIPEPLKKLIRVVGATPLVMEMLKTVDIWIGHMMSDVSTSQGIPGVFLSLLKELSCLPGLRNTNLPIVVDGIYNKGILNLSKWGGVIFTASKKQAIPVLINEALVRGFYFVRHLVTEYKGCHDWNKVDWNRVIPIGNRTVERMMTIATGTFTAVDLTDAAIRGAIGSGGNWVGFAKEFILHVNFVGIGRFAIAFGTDVGMGIKRGKLVNERIKVMGQELVLLNTKVYYKCAVVHLAEVDMLETEEVMWITAKDTEEVLNELYESTREAAEYIQESLAVIHQDMVKISGYKDAIEKHNPGLVKNIVDTLKY